LLARRPIEEIAKELRLGRIGKRRRAGALCSRQELLELTL
jgi:hypothetical protein